MLERHRLQVVSLVADVHHDLDGEVVEQGAELAEHAGALVP